LSKRKRQTGVLNLMDTPRTWFRWLGNEQNVKDAPAEVFDDWIAQYVDTINGVDRSTWEIFHRWGITNACIDGQLLVLVARPDGSLIVEEKASGGNSNETVSQAVVVQEAL